MYFAFQKKKGDFFAIFLSTGDYKGEDGGKLKVSRREGGDNRKERMGKLKVGYRYEREEMMNL